MLASIAKRAFWRRTPCVFNWRPTSCARISALCDRLFRRARTDEPVFRTFGQRFGDGGAALARGTAHRESGQRRDDGHAGGRSVSAEGRGVRKLERGIPI